jgi:YbgC/YbaW family acyl-CoA thioester hydrolase
MAHAFSHERRIEFSDTDLAGIVHFSNFFRFMEAAEHAFFRSLGFQLHEHREGRQSGFARVQARCDYLRPLHYPDLVRVELVVCEKTEASFAYDFTFFDERSAEPAARGSLKVVHVARGAHDERLRAAPMPTTIFECIEVAPAL